MAWKLRQKLRQAPAGVDFVAKKLEEFEDKMRTALDAPMDDKRRNELSWPIHKLHYERNRFVHDLHYKEGKISKKLLDYLVKEKLCDGKLMAMWRKQGYERLCSLQAITKSNTNFRTVSVCRTPLRHRTGQITPNVMTGCVSCASGDKGPIWWDDPVPDIAKRRIAAIDPGKLCLLDGDPSVAAEENGHADEDVDDEVAERIRKLRRTMPSVSSNEGAQAPRATRDAVPGEGVYEEPQVMERVRKLRASIRNENASCSAIPCGATSADGADGTGDANGQNGDDNGNGTIGVDSADGHTGIDNANARDGADGTSGISEPISADVADGVDNANARDGADVTSGISEPISVDVANGDESRVVGAKQ